MGLNGEQQKQINQIPRNGNHSDAGEVQEYRVVKQYLTTAVEGNT